MHVLKQKINMKFRISYIALFLLIIPGIISAQTDKKAKEILDKLSAKTKSYKSYRVSFSFSLVNKEEKINENKDGILTVKGAKYHLKIDGQEIYCDGKNIYTYLKESNEAQLTSTDDQDEDAVTPQSIFTIYEKGFKYRYIKEEKSGNKMLQIIDLYPIDPKKKDYSIIKLFIDEAAGQVTKAIINGKNGSVYTYNIKKMDVNPEVSDASFAFDKSKYPGVKIIR